MIVWRHGVTQAFTLQCWAITRQSELCENKVFRIFTLEQVNLVWTIKVGSLTVLDSNEKLTNFKYI